MTDTNKQKDIYFHVGLGKTATTYLQYRFFPKMKGIHYLQRGKYRKADQIIPKLPYDKILVSREFDRLLNPACEWFSKHFPQARVIVVFRRHDSWIASQYRRFAKNGIHQSFDEFFDIENDKGKWRHSDLNYMNYIRIIEKYFKNKPLVLFQEDLKKDPFGFFDKIAQYTGSTYDKNKISLRPVHTSYNEKQIKAVRKVSKYLFSNKAKARGRTVRGWLQWRSQQIKSYLVMYTALLLPDSWFDDVELIPPDRLKKIKEIYTPDWEELKAYAEKYNP